MNLRKILGGLILSGVIISSVSAGSAEARLVELKIDLPATSKPVANYVPVVQSGNLVFLAGHIPKDEGGEFITGKVGLIPNKAASPEGEPKDLFTFLAKVFLFEKTSSIGLKPKPARRQKTQGSLLPD